MKAVKYTICRYESPVFFNDKTKKYEVDTFELVKEVEISEWELNEKLRKEFEND